MKKSKALVVAGAEPSPQDLQIFNERIGGASERSLSRKYGLPSKEIWAAIDRCLPSLDLAARHRAILIEHERVDRMFGAFYKKALDGCVQSGLLCLRLVERRAAMLGADISPMRVDPLAAVPQTERKSSTAAVREIIDRIVAERPPRTIDVTPVSASEPESAP